MRVWTSKERNQEGEDHREPGTGSGNSVGTEEASKEIRNRLSNYCGLCANFGHTDQECFLATQEDDKWEREAGYKSEHAVCRVQHMQAAHAGCSTCRVHRQCEKETPSGSKKTAVRNGANKREEQGT